MKPTLLAWSLGFKFFIPSWRFFDQAGPFFFLEVQDGVNTKWRALLSPPKIGFLNFFVNPHGNLYLAQMNIIERFAIEFGCNDQILESPLYSQVVELIHQNLARHGQGGDLRFRFQIRMSEFASSEEKILFVSDFLSGAF